MLIVTLVRKQIDKTKFGKLLLYLPFETVKVIFSLKKKRIFAETMLKKAMPGTRFFKKYLNFVKKLKYRI